MADKDSENSEKQASKTIPILEWIVAAIGLILVVATIGFMLYKSFTSQDSPPHFVASVEKISEINSGYLVIFKVKNEGERTASGVEVEAVIKNGEEILETSGATMDYVPSKSESKGGLFFKNDPKQFPPEIRVKGYSEP